ncbi:MAG TPA: leucine-rich repeat protein [Verrucomicrobiae bacterium]|nr:leucine-rich repeat protein [Verrucomicrobiae bacterium]
MKVSSAIVKTAKPNTMAGRFENARAAWFLVLLLIMLVPVAVQAQYNYVTNSDNTITITGYVGAGGDVSFPSTINGLTVTTIGGGTFLEFANNLTSVTIPSTVTNIGSYAFLGCGILTNVTIGASVAAIGTGAFDLCAGLTSVTIPNSVTSVGDLAFADCTNLTAVYFQGNAPSFPDSGAFEGDHVTIYYSTSTTGWGLTTLILPGTETWCSFEMPLGGVCLHGTFPITITTASGSVTGTVSMSVSPKGAVSGQLLLESETFSLTGKYAASPSSTVLSLSAANGSNKIKLTGTLQGSEFTGTTKGTGTIASGEGTFVLDVSAASALVADVSLNLAENSKLVLSGTGTVTVCGAQLPVKAKGKHGATFTLSIKGTSFSWSGELTEGTNSQPLVSGSAAGFGAKATASNLPLTMYLSLSPAVASVAASAGSGNISVTASRGYSWTATSDSTWLHTTSSGTGNGTASYSYDANYTTTARAGHITVGGQVFTLTQAGVTGCGYSLSPTSSGVGAGAGSGNITVSTGVGCSWTASSDSAWLHTTSTGTGKGTVDYSFDANSGTTSRTGNITVGGQTFPVTQAAVGGCSYSLSPTNASVACESGSGAIYVTAGSGCAWSAASDSAWLHTSSTGTGSGTVNYSYDGNPYSEPRTGNITVGGLTFPVAQAGSTSIEFELPDPLGTIQQCGTFSYQIATPTGGAGAPYTFSLGSTLGGSPPLSVIVAPSGLVSGLVSSPEGNYSFEVCVTDEAGTELCQDTSIDVTAPPEPGTPSDPSPVDGATGVGSSVTLTWAATPNADSYEVYFGTANPPPHVSNVTVPSYSPSTLSANKTYYWQIIAVHNMCSSLSPITTEGPVWSFKTSSGGAGVTVTSGTCTIQACDGCITLCDCPETITFKGTATGPVGTQITADWPYTFTGWTATVQGWAERKSGDPETVSWTVVIGGSSDEVMEQPGTAQTYDGTGSLNLYPPSGGTITPTLTANCPLCQCQ